MTQPRENAPEGNPRDARRPRRRILAASATAAASAVAIGAIYAGMHWGPGFYGARIKAPPPQAVPPAMQQQAAIPSTVAPPPKPAGLVEQAGNVALPAPLTDPALTVNDRPVAAPPTGVSTAALRQAIDAYRGGKLGDGDGAATRINDPAARALLEWLAIRYNGSSMGFERIDAFVRKYPDWPAGNLAQRQAEYALMRQKAGPDAVIAFFTGKEPQTPHGALLLADARRARGDATTAARLIVNMWRNDPLPVAIEKRLVAEYPQQLTQAENRNRMEHFLLQEKWDVALRAATLAGPDHVKLARARMAVAQVKQPGKAAEKALDAVPAALRKDPSWQFSKALFLRKKEDNDDALAIHKAVPQEALDLDGGDEWWIERRILARRYLDAGKADIAYDLVRRHGAERDALKIEAEFHAGWIALRYLGKAEAALGHFDAAARIAGTPVSLARTAYWRGRAHEALGDLAAARADYDAAARHGTAYYGQLARIKLADNGLSVSPPAPPATNNAIDSLPVRAIRLLHEADADDLATPLYVGVAKTLDDPGVIDLVARLAANRNDARSMVMIGKAAMQRGLPLADVAWPVQGVPQFAQTGKAVERAMVLAISRQESVFDPTAMSSAGARGLMQLMPATAQRTAQRAGQPFDQGRLTTDATYNARLGAWHLGDLLDDWRGSYILTFAAYNAGGGNVKKWITAHGDPRDPGVDPVDWVERIPFSETRNYVQRVMENLQVYRQRLAPGAPLRMADDLKRGMVAMAASGPAPSQAPVPVVQAPLATSPDTTASIRPAAESLAAD